MPVLHNLVISGGGINGLGFLGIIKYLYEKNLIKNINHYIGTSAGAIISFLMSIGYSYSEIYEFCCYFNFSKITDNVNLNCFLEKYGLEDSSKIYYILKRLCENKKYDPNITFLELYEKTNIKLTITGSCISNSKLYYFNHETFPNMQVLLAVRISSTIPLVFVPIIFEDKLWLDGGLINNYPINYCENDINNTLGLSINDDCIDKCPNNTPSDLMEYMTQVFKCLVFSDSLNKINKYNDSTIKFTYSMKLISNFDITKDTVEQMVQNGYEQASQQHHIISKFINEDDDISTNEVLSQSESDVLSQSESEAIHQIINDVEYISQNNINNESENNSDDISDNENTKNDIIDLIKKDSNN